MAIALFTDYGSRDPYIGQVKAVFAREAPGEPIIDLLNDAPAFDVRAASHLLTALVPTMPQGTVFVAVVDPGVGGRRSPVVVRADGYCLVGPDNGLLSVFSSRAAHARISRIRCIPARLSASFHGRDLFAPVAARIAAGALPARALTPIAALEVELGAADLREIIYVDHYGNAMTGIRAAALTASAHLVAGGRRLRYARVFSAVREGETFWYENSIGLVEIAANRASAADLLGLRIGSPVLARRGGRAVAAARRAATRPAPRGSR